MRKILGVITFCFMFILSQNVYATQVGNPNTVLGEGEDITVQAGSEIDYLFERDLELKMVAPGTSASQGGEMESFTSYMAKFSVTFADVQYLTPYIRIGTCSFEARYNDNVKIKTENGIIWGGGLAGNIISLDQGFKLGADLSYLYTDIDLDTIDFTGIGVVPLTPADIGNPSIEYTELQLSLVASYKIDQLEPYGGFKYSNAEGEMAFSISGVSGKLELENDDKVGMFVGLDYLPKDNIAVNIEGRIIDDQAIAIACTYQF